MCSTPLPPLLQCFEHSNILQIKKEVNWKSLGTPRSLCENNFTKSTACLAYFTVSIIHIFWLVKTFLQFHHRDPGLVGLLASSKIPPGRTVYYGIIADGIHTNPAALRIAYKTHPEGVVLTTDAISAMGLDPGRYSIGSTDVEVTKDRRAYVTGTTTLAGRFDIFFFVMLSSVCIYLDHARR